MPTYSFDLKSRRIGTVDAPADVVSDIDFLNHFQTLEGGELLSALGPNMTTPNGATIGAPGIYQGSSHQDTGVGRYWRADFPTPISLLGVSWTFELSAHMTSGTSAQLFRITNSTGGEILSANITPGTPSGTRMSVTIGPGVGGSGGGSGLAFGTGSYPSGTARRFGFQMNAATNTLSMYVNGAFVANNTFGTTIFTNAISTIYVGLGRLAAGANPIIGYLDEAIFARRLLYPSSPPPFTPDTP